MSYLPVLIAVVSCFCVGCSEPLQENCDTQDGVSYWLQESLDSLPERLQRDIASGNYDRIRAAASELDWSTADTDSTVPKSCWEGADIDESFQIFVPPNHSDYVGSIVQLYFIDRKLKHVEFYRIRKGL